MKQRAWLLIVLVLAGTFLSMQSPAAVEPVIEMESLDFIEADLRDVFRSLGLAGGYNVLLTREVQGTVTITLKHGMPVKDAIGLIAHTYEYDLRWLEEKHTVVIGKAATLKDNFDTNVKITRVFTLRYSTVTEIAEALRIVVDPKQLASNPRTNQVTLIGSQIEVDNATEIIGQMDHAMPQVNIEARMEEIIEDSARDLGVKWPTSLEYGVGSGFSILAYPAIKATLNILENENKAVLVAQPNITCQDAQEAEIFIGDKYPVVTSQVVEGKTVYLTNFVDIGTKLNVKPRVNTNDVVTVSIKVDVSSWTQTVSTDAGDIPVIRTRTTQSITRLRNGQTFVLTGLIRRESTTDTTGVPLLDKLPLLSALFKNTRKTGKNTVICIFITPNIVPVSGDEIQLGQTTGTGATTTTGTGPTTATGTDKQTGAATGTGSATTGQTGLSTEPGGSTGSPAVGAGSTPPGTGTQPGVVPGTPSAGPAGSGTATSTGGVPDTQTGDTSLSAEEMAEQANPALAADPVTVPADPAPGSPETGPTVATEPTVPTEPATPPATTPAAEPAAPAGTGTTPAITATPGSPALPRPEDIKYVKYRVKKGDSLAAIGRKFGVPYQEIAAYNGLSTRATLRVGQEIRVPIPDSHKYVVKPKETLWRIAKRYGVTVELLVEINNLADATKIEVGQVIVLPCPVSRVANPGY